MRTTYFKVNFNIASKSKKNILSMSLLIIFTVLFVLVVELQNLGDNYRQWRSYYESLEVNISYFNSSLLRKHDFKETYDNLNQQEGYISSLQNGEVLNNPQLYLESYQKLLHTMIDGYNNNYKGADTLSIPPKYQLRQRLVIYQYLHDYRIPVMMNSKSSVTYLIFIFNIISIYIYIYILIISSDIWLIKINHPTLLKSIPYRVRDEVTGKTLINMVLVFVPLMIGLIGAYIFAGMRNGFRSLNYPNVFYFSNIRAIPIWYDIFLFLLYTAFLIAFVTSLTLVLNQITKNVYLSILIGIAFYITSYLPNKMLKFIFWLPCPYLNVRTLFDGTLASKTGLMWLNIASGSVVLLIWTFLLFNFFGYLVTKGRKA
ncbi:ABC transporter permease [Lactobacillus panisapium]|uniref:ABC transporter permease n=1 Tax=Lactobacillus panisapium TaxID=2012495 RepID=UPI001C6A6DD5|nr:ABC transporter permease [Lactobacillus panisapium]QYN59374.1 ABC transporter permease [Lactobacillus panisapium]